MIPRRLGAMVLGCLLAVPALAGPPVDPSRRLVGILDGYVDSGTLTDYSLLPGARDDKGDLSVRGGISMHWDTGSLRSGGMALESRRDGGVEIFGRNGTLEVSQGTLTYGNIYMLLGTRDPLDPGRPDDMPCGEASRMTAVVLDNVNFKAVDGMTLSALVTAIFLRERVEDGACISEAGVDARELSILDAGGQTLLSGTDVRVLAAGNGAEMRLTSSGPDLHHLDIVGTPLVDFLSNVLSPFRMSGAIPESWRSAP